MVMVIVTIYLTFGMTHLKTTTTHAYVRIQTRHTFVQLNSSSLFI